MTTLPISLAMPPLGGSIRPELEIMPEIGRVTSKPAERPWAGYGSTTCCVLPSSSLPRLPCHCRIKRMTATHLQLSPRSSLMPLALPLERPFKPVRRVASHSLARMHLG